MSQPPQWSGSGQNDPWGGQQPQGQPHSPQQGGYPQSGGYPQQGGQPSQGPQQQGGWGQQQGGWGQQQSPSGPPPGGYGQQYGGGGYGQQPPGGGGFDQQPPEKKGPNGWMIGSIIAAVVIILGGVAAFIFWPDGEDTASPTPEPSQSSPAEDPTDPAPDPTDPSTEPAPDPTDPSTEPAPDPTDPSTDPSTPANTDYEVGTCAELTGTEANPTVTSLDCADAQSATSVPFEIVEVYDGDGTCGENLTEYWEYEGSSRTVTLCMGELLVDGSCYANDAASLSGITEATCPDGDFQVTATHMDATTACGGDEQSVVYSTWPRTYCLGPTQ